MGKSKNIIILIYYLAYLFISLGWFFYKSADPAIFCYSWRYLLFLILISMFFFLPSIIRIYLKSIGGKGAFYSLIIFLVFLSVAYLVFSVIYYRVSYRLQAQSEHLFDPYLQRPNTKFQESVVKGNTTFRILCLGGSTTFCINLPRKERYPNILQAILQKHYSLIKIEVLNAGKDWYTTKHALINYATYYRYWKPDLIIVLQGINDLYRSFSPPRWAIGEYNDQWSHFYGPSIQGAKSEPPPTFEQYLYAHFLQKIINAWYPSFKFKSWFVSRTKTKHLAAEVDYPLERYVSIKMFERHLRAIVKYAKSDNTDVLLVSEPSLYEENMEQEEKGALWFGKEFCGRRVNAEQMEYPSYKSLNNAMRMFNQTVKSVASSEDIIFVDAAKRMPHNLQNFVDDCHYTKSGVELLAQLISEEIIDSEIVEKRIKNNTSN